MYWSKILCAFKFHDWELIEPRRLLGDQNIETREFRQVGTVRRYKCSRCSKILNCANTYAKPQKVTRWIEK